jgi:hypothetical protein
VRRGDRSLRGSMRLHHIVRMLQNCQYLCVTPSAIRLRFNRSDSDVQRAEACEIKETHPLHRHMESLLGVTRR